MRIILNTVVRGSVQLWALVMLSLLAMTLFLFDEQFIARFRMYHYQQHNHIHQQQQHITYVMQQNFDQLCENQGGQQASGITTFDLRLQQDHTLANHHVISCIQSPLFRQVLTQAIHTPVNDFLDNEKIMAYRSQWLSLPITILSTPAIIFIPEYAHWELTQDIYAVVVAPNGLQLSGNGRIIGALLHNGELQLDEYNAVVYSSAVVQMVQQKYQPWRYQVRSWRDFTVY